jgi:hypothetical protein
MFVVASASFRLLYVMILREYLDRIWFWNQSDLEQKLEDYKGFYNNIAVTPD